MPTHGAPLDPTDRPAPRPAARAEGSRLPYARTPAPIRHWVERELGSAVVAARDQTGGFSPGPAARLVTADGGRAFLKAAGTDLNDESPGIFRHEIASLQRLPDGPWRPRLLATYDDGDWVAVLLADVEGRQPDGWAEHDVRVVFDALTGLSEELSRADWPDAPRLVEQQPLGQWRTLAGDPPGDLPAWVRGRLGELVELDDAAAWELDGERLTHFDVRADNLLITPSDTVVFLDWSWTCRAAPWADALLTALDLRVSGSAVDVDELLARHPLTRGVDPYALTAAIAGFAGMLTLACRRPPPPGLPTIREFQRPVADHLLDWARYRMGW